MAIRVRIVLEAVVEKETTLLTGKEVEDWAGMAANIRDTLRSRTEYPFEYTLSFSGVEREEREEKG